MHYANGREAKNGDKVMITKGYGAPKVGILYDAVAGVDSCNGRLAEFSSSDSIPNLADCLHLDDALAMLDPKPVEADKKAEAPAAEASPAPDAPAAP